MIAQRQALPDHGFKAPPFLQQYPAEGNPSADLSRKNKGSNNWYKAKDDLNRLHEKISHKRRDWFWKLAHELTNEYDVLIFEDLNLLAMKKLWGRKISDLSFSTLLVRVPLPRTRSWACPQNTELGKQIGALDKRLSATRGRTAFLEILETVVNNKGKTIHFIERFYPSSKTCFDCGYHNKELTLKDRAWDCPDCGTKLDRDLNAAQNIQREGASSLKVGDVRRSSSAIAA